MQCKHYEDNIILLLYNELAEKKKKQLFEHMENCSRCSAFLEENKKMFSDISEAVPDKFDPAWDAYWMEINRGMKRKEKEGWSFFPIPSGAAAFAMSVIILITGIAIGKFFSISAQKETETLQAGKNNNSLLYINNYFEDVKPVMLDYANYTIPAANGNGGPVDKEIIKGMLDKTRLLQRHVSRVQNPYVASLLEELELILTEIKNTTPGERDSMKSLQGMIRERDIPLKIDLFKNKGIRSERI